MIKKLVGCIREYRRPTILSPVFVAFEVLTECFIPFLMAKLIDNGITPGNLSYILKMGGVLVLLAMLSLFFGTMSGKCAAEAMAGFAKNVRQDMYHNVQSFSFSNIDKFSTSSIVTRLTTDVTNVQQAFMMIVRIAVRSPVMLVFALIMSFSINSRISLIFLVAIPVLGVGLYFIMTRAHPIFVRVFKTYDKLNQVVQENVRGIRVVKSFVREDYEKEKFAGVSKNIYDDFSKAEKLINLNSPLMLFVVYSLMLAAAWIGAHLIVSGSMTTGQLTSIITYSMQILISLMMLSIVFVMITISRASAQRITEILSEKSDLNNCGDPVYSVPDGGIEFDDVSFSYGGKKKRMSLSGVNLTIRSGETVGIIGGTGTSKSTLVQLIPRLYDATEGTVKVGGIDVRNYDIKTLRESVAMVLQKNELFSGTIKENLRWGNENATDEEMRAACRLAQADEFISAFPDGYDTYIEQGGSNVSGGQKQRLCIARAVLKNPKILILDDSTSAVDTATDAKIRAGFKSFIPETTKIIIAQRIASVSEADKIVVMDGGRVNAVGTHEELLETNEIYKEVFYSQQKGGEGK